jgi:hypothetical protein
MFAPISTLDFNSLWVITIGGVHLVSSLPNSPSPTILALMSPMFIIFHQHLQLFPLTESRVFTIPMAVIMLALLMSMVLVPSSMSTESMAPTLVIFSFTLINTMSLRQCSCQHHLNEQLKDFIVFCEFKAMVEMFVGVIEDDNEDLQYQDVFSDLNQQGIMQDK